MVSIYEKQGFCEKYSDFTEVWGFLGGNLTDNADEYKEKSA